MANVSYLLPNLAYVQQAASGDAAINYSADYMRRVLGAVFNTGGILTLTDLQVKQRGAGANFSIDITPGVAIIPFMPLTYRAYEKFMYANYATFTVDCSTLTTSPTSTRTHKVYLAIYDSNYGSAANSYNAKIFVGEDTGSGAPNPGPGPFPGVGDAVGYLQLATFTIGPSQSSITDANITNVAGTAGYYQNWVNLSSYLNTGVDILSNSPPQYQRRGSTVRFRGGCIRSGSPTFPPGDFTLITPAKMPAAITPTGSRTAYFAVGIQYGSLSEVAAARLQISAAAGVVVHVSSTASNPDTVFLDGATYDLN